MSRLLRRTLIGVALGVLLYVGAMLYFDFAPVRESLQGYAWSSFVAALVLSSLNYLLRFAKWELSLRWLDIRSVAPRLSLGRSLLIYIAGLSMSVTPGKVGEVLRSVLLRASDDVPVARTAPIVVADRLTDLVALVLLSLLGVLQFREYLPFIAMTIALVVAGVLVLGSPRLLHAILRAATKLAPLRRFVDKAETLVDAMTALLRMRRVLVLSLLSVVGWGLECVGFWLVLEGFADVDCTLATATFLWSAGTLIGALSFLPGGLGATEGSLVLATGRWVQGVTQPIAFAGVLLARTATLWFGELIGAIALGLFLRDKELRAKARAQSEESR